MHPPHLWHFYHIYGKKIVLFLLLLCGLQAQAQQSFQYNLPYSDARWLHYGFTIGLHTAGFKLKYSDAFTSDKLDTVHSIMPDVSFGFSLGFITDFRLHDQFNIRVLPKVSFYEFSVDYFYTDESNINQLIEATYVEVPILLKYKSERHKNFRMYLVGGIAPGLEVSGKKRKENSTNKLLTHDFNISAEAGFGVDMYFPLFKFSPEVRFSRGLLNILKEDQFGYSEGIESLHTNVVTFYLQFSD